MPSSEKHLEAQQTISAGGDIAIIGMACIFPGAPDLPTYWQNIVSKFDAITDVPPERWDSETFFDPHANQNDRVYCSRGGFLGAESLIFNPLDYGIMPLAVDGGDPSQFLALKVARQALTDAGYMDRPVNWERTEIILGRGNYLDRGIGNVTQHSRVIEQTLQIIKRLHPEYTPDEFQAIRRALKASLPYFGPENAPSLIPNITTGRIANRLNLMGANFTVDAACASTLIATELGMRDLATHKCDMALSGGIFILPDVPFSIIFCQLNALSKQSHIRPFDKHADGTVIGEGVGIIVLKRLADAERDEDRIYAIIKGVGVASDGRAMSITAPRPEGQELALRRAYEMTGISPQSIGLIEAHGTGTTTGDGVELETLRKVFGDCGRAGAPCALGTIKSMIGHAMPAAGAAGIIKTVLAIYHKVLPPSLHCSEPHPGLTGAPFYINSETRPWIHGAKEAPRRAGVNAFGFGGINTHMVLEEYIAPDKNESKHLHSRWETEVCIVQGQSRQSLIDRAQHLHGYLTAMLATGGVPVPLKDVAYTLNAELEPSSRRLAIVASTVEELQHKLEHALKRLSDAGCTQIKDRSGIYFFEKPLGGRLAFLFPGEGSQYVNMLSDLCIHFPEVRTCFDEIDTAFIGHPRGYLPSQLIFPPPFLSQEEKAEAEGKIWQMDGAIEAVFTVNKALFTLLTCLGLKPDVTVGHSTGEFSAIFASGVTEINLERMGRLNRIYEESAAQGHMSQADMVAVGASYEAVSSIVHEVAGDIYIAMDNCPHQVVLVGEPGAMERATAMLRRKGVICETLPFSRPYHTPLFGQMCDNFRQFFSEQPIHAPTSELWSCATIQPYPRDAAEMQKLVADQWIQPVEFRKTIEAMYDADVRIFVEVGARGNLTAFVDDILRGKRYLAVPSNVVRRSGITQLNHLAGLLAAQGIPLDLNYLYARRTPVKLSLDAAADASVGRKPTAGAMKLALGFPSMNVAALQSMAAERPELDAAARGATLSGSGVKTPGAPVSVSPAEFSGGMHRRDALSLLGIRDGLEHPAPKNDATGESDGKPVSYPTFMEDYMQTMENFLDLQQQVMKAYLGGGNHPAELADVTEHVQPAEGGVSAFPADKGGEGSSGTAVQSFPFIGIIISHVPNEELVAHRQVSLTEDIFLHDHALGSKNSTTDDTLSPLHVIPMTVSMEIMAEAAATLLPGKTVTGLRDIRAYRWIPVEEQASVLTIKARRVTSGTGAEVTVSIEMADDGAETPSEQDMTVAEGRVILEDDYPEPTHTPSLTLKSPRAPRHTAEALYQEKLMFHGPRFQGVASLDRCGEDGIVGHLQVLPNTNIFRSPARPPLVLDPFLLDAAGQLVGYWPMEYLETGFLAFPIRLKELRLYGNHPPASARLRCEVRIGQITAKQIRADLDIIGPDGRTWARLIGWEDWRFYFAPEFFDFWRNPRDHCISAPCSAAVSGMPAPESFEFYQLPAFDPDQIFSKELWAYLILNRAEREVWRNMKKPAAKKTEWLLGRLVAKDAVRMFLKKRHGMELCPADIEIAPDEHGRPVPRGTWMQVLQSVPVLSLAHTEGMAVAIACGSAASGMIGIDVESIKLRGDGFENIALDENERTLLAQLPDALRGEWIIRFWCAKEAVAKALGRGLLQGPRSVVIQEMNRETGTVKAALHGVLAREAGTLAQALIMAYTLREDTFIIATSRGKAG